MGIPRDKIVELLCVVTNLHFRAPTNFPVERLELVEYRFQKGRLTGAVWTNDAETLATPQYE